MAEQAFQLSFGSREDLPARIVSRIQSRMHRIRYVWPFSAGAPIVIRDSALTLKPGTAIKVQRITWLDPERNDFRAGQIFQAPVGDVSFFRYELDADTFSRAIGLEGRLDPMSNAAFRVILLGPADEPRLFVVLTYALVGCFVFAGATAGWTLLRKPSARPLSSPPRPSSGWGATASPTQPPASTSRSEP